MEKSVDSDDQSVAEKLTLEDMAAEPDVSDVDCVVDVVVDENNRKEEVQDELDDGEIVEPKDKAETGKQLQYSYEPGAYLLFAVLI